MFYMTCFSSGRSIAYFAPSTHREHVAKDLRSHRRDTKPCPYRPNSFCDSDVQQSNSDLANSAPSASSIRSAWPGCIDRTPPVFVRRSEGSSADRSPLRKESSGRLSPTSSATGRPLISSRLRTGSSDTFGSVISDHDTRATSCRENRRSR